MATNPTMRASLSPSRKRQGQFKPWDTKLGTAQRARSTEPSEEDREIAVLMAVRGIIVYWLVRARSAACSPPPTIMLVTSIWLHATVCKVVPFTALVRVLCGVDARLQAVEQEVARKREIAAELAACKAILQENDRRQSRNDHLCVLAEIECAQKQSA